MCGRYLTKDQRALERELAYLDVKDWPEWAGSYNTAPSQLAPVRGAASLRSEPVRQLVPPATTDAGHEGYGHAAIFFCGNASQSAYSISVDASLSQSFGWLSK